MQLSRVCVHTMLPAASPPARLLAAGELIAVADGTQQRRLRLPAPSAEWCPAPKSCGPPSDLGTPQLARASPDWQPENSLRAMLRPYYDAQHRFSASPVMMRQQRGVMPASGAGRGFATASQAEQDAQEVQKLLHLLQDIPHHRWVSVTIHRTSFCHQARADSAIAWHHVVSASYRLHTICMFRPRSAFELHSPVASSTL